MTQLTLHAPQDFQLITPDTDTVDLAGPSNQWKMTDPVVIGAGVALTIRGHGTLLEWDTQFQARHPLVTIGGRDLTIGAGFGIRGPKPTTAGWTDMESDGFREGQPGLEVDAAPRVVLDGIGICNTWGDGIRMDGVDHTLICRSYIHQTGRHGVCSVSGDHTIIAANTLLAIHGWGCSLEPYSSTSTVNHTQFVWNTYSVNIGIPVPSREG